MRDKDIRKLVKIVEESNISELEVSRWGKKVRILKHQIDSNHTHQTSTVTQDTQVKPAERPSVETTEQPVPPPKEAPVEKTAPKEAEEQKGVQEIRSPMVGTFYRAPAPEADPYVDVGDRVVPGKVLCIVEAMKLMNEIEAEISGKITEILVKNAEPVEYNQPLFKVAVD